MCFSAIQWRNFLAFLRECRAFWSEDMPAVSLIVSIISLSFATLLMLFQPTHPLIIVNFVTNIVAFPVFYFCFRGGVPRNLWPFTATLFPIEYRRRGYGIAWEGAENNPINLLQPRLPAATGMRLVRPVFHIPIAPPPFSPRVLNPEEVRRCIYKKSHTTELVKPKRRTDHKPMPTSSPRQFGVSYRSNINPSRSPNNPQNLPQYLKDTLNLTERRSQSLTSSFRPSSMSMRESAYRSQYAQDSSSEQHKINVSSKLPVGRTRFSTDSFRSNPMPTRDSSYYPQCSQPSSFQHPNFNDPSSLRALPTTRLNQDEMLSTTGREPYSLINFGASTSKCSDEDYEMNPTVPRRTLPGYTKKFSKKIPDDKELCHKNVEEVEIIDKTTEKTENISIRSRAEEGTTSQRTPEKGDNVLQTSPEKEKSIIDRTPKEVPPNPLNRNSPEKANESDSDKNSLRLSEGSSRSNSESASPSDRSSSSPEKPTVIDPYLFERQHSDDEQFNISEKKIASAVSLELTKSSSFDMRKGLQKPSSHQSAETSFSETSFSDPTAESQEKTAEHLIQQKYSKYMRQSPRGKSSTAFVESPSTPMSRLPSLHISQKSPSKDESDADSPSKKRKKETSSEEDDASSTELKKRDWSKKPLLKIPKIEESSESEDSK